MMISLFSLVHSVLFIILYYEIFPFIHISVNRRLSRRPSTSRQLKSNTGKKQKEKKSKTKRGAENRKISISPEVSL